VRVAQVQAQMPVTVASLGKNTIAMNAWIPAPMDLHLMHKTIAKLVNKPSSKL